MHVPREIDGAHVLRVARLEGTNATGVTRHHRDGARQADFARLALAQYEDDDGVYLFYCDEAWNCLNDTLHADLAEAETHAAAEFDGVSFTDA